MRRTRKAQLTAVTNGQQDLFEHARELSMGTPKEEVRKLLDQIPDDSTFEDIQYHIYVREKIERGLKDVEEGRMLGHEEVERRMAKWLGK